MQAEEQAMHRIYERSNQPEIKQRRLPKVGLPRRRLKFAQKIPMDVKRQLKAEVERLRKELQQKAISDGNATDNSHSETEG